MINKQYYVLFFLLLPSKHLHQFHKFFFLSGLIIMMNLLRLLSSVDD